MNKVLITRAVSGIDHGIELLIKYQNFEKPHLYIEMIKKYVSNGVAQLQKSLPQNKKGELIQKKLQSILKALDYYIVPLNMWLSLRFKILEMIY